MEVNIDIPDRVFRKIKALNTLEGGLEASIDEFIASLLEKAIDNGIRSHLGDEASAVEAPMYRHPVAPPVKRFLDPTELSDGLGDFDGLEPEPESDMMDLIPRGGGALNEIEDDMDVDDPEHEAKAEAAPAGKGSADEIFSQITGIPLPIAPAEMEPDGRVLKRKRSVKLKGKVTPATSEANSF